MEWWKFSSLTTWLGKSLTKWSSYQVKLSRKRAFIISCLQPADKSCAPNWSCHNIIHIHMYIVQLEPPRSGHISTADTDHAPDWPRPIRTDLQRRTVKPHPQTSETTPPMSCIITILPDTIHGWFTHSTIIIKYWVIYTPALNTTLMIVLQWLVLDQ